ncbi:MAG: HAMP domain-containing histidine kinase [Magnetococcales bacterium]|nr:HAMP domain-containing histidine kinase [Magnetococcales bacterium]
MDKIKSLRQFVFVGLTSLGVVLVAIGYFFSQETRQIQQQAMLEQTVMGFLNTVLEVRRYEKNYFMFHNKSDFENALNYLDQLDQQVRLVRPAIPGRPDGSHLLAEIAELSVHYREKLLQYPMLSNEDARQRTALELTMHAVGKKINLLAEQLALDSRDNVLKMLDGFQITIVLAVLLLLLLLIGWGFYCFRSIVVPFGRIREGLAQVAAGQQETMEPFAAAQEFVDLTGGINLAMQKLLRGREERVRLAQHAFTDAVLLRLVKTLGQPMANISTACQILMEEERHASVAFQQEMLLQISQQAEQGRRILVAIQEYAVPQQEPAESIDLVPLLDNIMTSLQKQRGVHTESRVAMEGDLTIMGNRHSLERALADWIMLSTPSATQTGFITACRCSRQAMGAALATSCLRPLVWLPSDCQEVVEISLQMVGDGFVESASRAHDVSLLCVPQEDGDPGIYLLPGVMRQHGGAMLVQQLDASTLRFALWFPVIQCQEERLRQAVGVY